MATEAYYQPEGSSEFTPMPIAEAIEKGIKGPFFCIGINEDTGEECKAPVKPRNRKNSPYYVIDKGKGCHIDHCTKSEPAKSRKSRYLDKIGKKTGLNDLFTIFLKNDETKRKPIDKFDPIDTGILITKGNAHNHNNIDLPIIREMRGPRDISELYDLLCYLDPDDIYGQKPVKDQFVDSRSIQRFRKHLELFDNSTLLINCNKTQRYADIRNYCGADSIILRDGFDYPQGEDHLYFEIIANSKDKEAVHDMLFNTVEHKKFAVLSAWERVATDGKIVLFRSQPLQKCHILDVDAHCGCI